MVHAHHDSARRFLRRKYPGPLLWPVRVTLELGLAVRSLILRRRVKRAHATA
jgi:N-acetylglucosaminyl-diphospho-decaprenol L-rhamnosyltransferase